jgi:D-alanyl-D-alanine carboxypeptidase
MNFDKANPFGLLALFICLGLSIAHGEQALPGEEAMLNDKVDRLVRDKMYNDVIPGLTLAVVKDGKILKVQSYGFANVDFKVPVTTNTIFRIGSVSKQFIATAIMILVEEGKLNLDDPVGKYLDGTPRYWNKITIRNLLTHTSGIPDFLGENIPADTSPDAFDQSVFKAVACRRLHFAPGEEWRYSNSNYHLLGMIIRKITGKPYEDFLRERIFQPLGMTQTAVSPFVGNVPGLAVGYEFYTNNNRLMPDDNGAPSIQSDAAGGIVSTVTDMARWDAALYTDRLLKMSSLQQMWTPVRLNDGMTWPYGFGWDVGRINDHLIISHEGNTPGFSASIYRVVDDRLTVIILDNRFDTSGVAVTLAQKIARIYLWTGPDYRPIPDTEPKITARVRNIVDRGEHGRLREKDFTPAVWAELSPQRKEIQDEGRKIGPALSLTPVEHTMDTDKRSYRYWIYYKFGKILLHVVFDEQNKITVWKVEDVDLK